MAKENESEAEKNKEGMKLLKSIIHSPKFIKKLAAWQKKVKK